MIRKSFMNICLLLALVFFSAGAHAEWVDISQSIRLTYTRGEFDRVNKVISSYVTIENISPAPILGPLRLEILKPSIPVDNADGPVDTIGTSTPFFEINGGINGFDKVRKRVNFKLIKARLNFSAKVYKYYDDDSCHATQCYSDAVFFTTADIPVRLSNNFDNSTKSWPLSEEETDYRHRKFFEKNYTEAFNKQAIYSHLLYPYGSKGANYISGITGSGDIEFIQQTVENLGDRSPLILIHGWQGDNGYNNYLGSISSSNMPENYFKEFLAFWNSNSPIALTLRSRYKLYLYKYPSFEHISYNGRLLGEAIWSIPELRNYILSGKKLTLMGHSMGGLVARSFIEEHGVGYTLPVKFDEEGDPKGEFIQIKKGEDIVSRLITLATPHHGTPASIVSWIDNIVNLASLTKKNRYTPGASDLMWDNYDRAIDVMLIDKIDIASVLDNDFYTMTDPKTNTEYEVFFWRQRDRLDRFDKFYGEFNGFDLWSNNENGQCLVTQTGEDVCYEHPNPWLRHLNKSLASNNGNSVEYIFYGGSLVSDAIRDSVPCNPFLSNGWNVNFIDSKKLWKIGQCVFIYNTNYFLGDMVVPTSSAFMDTNNYLGSVLGWERVWTNDFVQENLSNYLELPSDLINKYVERNTWYGNMRYFHDYDHDKMRGGSGNNNDINSAMPNDYQNNWYDIVSLKLLLRNIGYGLPIPDLSDPSNLLIHEPLFLKIASDLGVDISSNNTSQGLIAYYPFDGDATDASGNGLDGTIMGGDKNFGPGIKGSAIQLDGIDDWVSFANHTSESFQVKDLTLSVWFKTNSSSPIESLVQNSDGHAYGLTHYAINLINGNQISGAYRAKYPVKTRLSANIPYPAVWHHAVLVRDTTNKKGKLYLDGVLVDSSADVDSTLPIIPQSFLRIGRYVNDLNGMDTYFNGSIDEVRIYNRALSDTEINKLYLSDAVLFFDDFSGDLSAWTDQGNNEWSIQNGALFVNYDVACGNIFCPQTDLIVNDLYQPVGSYKASVDFVRTQVPGYPTLFQAVATFSIWKDQNTKFQIVIGGSGWNSWGGLQDTINVSVQQWNGSWKQTLFSTFPYNWDPDTWNTASIVKQGNTYSLYVNDHYLTSFSDTFMNGQGKIGLHAYGARRFDNFVIYNLN